MSALETVVRLETREPEVIVRLMLTLSSATDLYLGDLTRRGYSERTVDTYRRLLYKLCDRLPNDYDVGRVTVDDVRRFLDLWNHRAPGTRAHLHAVLAGFFDWLVACDEIKRSPLATIARPRRKRAEDLDVVAVDAAGVRQLLAAAQTWTEKLAIAIPAYIGPRRRAVAMLRLRDYDQERCLLRFREKGGKVIWKPVPKELAELLAAALTDGAFKDGEDYLVPPEGNLVRKGIRDDRVIWRVVKRVANRAGVETTVHALRAAFACFYLEQNPGDTFGLKELLGHSSFDTTQVYLRKLDKGQAMQRVREFSWTAPPAPSIDELAEPGSWVYLIAVGDFKVDGTPVKIGVSADVPARLCDLQAAHHEQLVLVATVPGSYGLEAHLHAEFAADRIRGEWFRSSPKMRLLVAMLETRMNTGEDAYAGEAAPFLMGAGGFEPPFPENPHGHRAGRQHPGPSLVDDLTDAAREVAADRSKVLP